MASVTYILDYTINISTAIGEDYLGAITRTSTAEAPILPGTISGDLDQFIVDSLAILSSIDPDAEFDAVISGNNIIVTSSVTFDDADTEVPVFFAIQPSSIAGLTYYPFIQEPTVCPEPEPDPITQCAECITVEQAACAAAYTFTAGLTASTDYVAVLSDHFGRQYTQDITSGVDGDFTIDATGDFPLGFWTPENSPIEIWVRESVNDSNEAITVSSVEYPCIKLNLVYRDDANPIVLTMFITTDYGIPITNDSGEELLDE